MSWFYYNKGDRLSFKYKNTLNNETGFSVCTMEMPQVGRPSFLFLILKSLHTRSRQIKSAKYKNLLTLLDYIPPIYHPFYKGLKHEETGCIKSGTNKHAENMPVNQKNTQIAQEDDNEEEESVIINSDYGGDAFLHLFLNNIYYKCT